MDASSKPRSMRHRRAEIPIMDSCRAQVTGETVKGNDPCRFHHPPSSEAVPLFAAFPECHQKRRCTNLPIDLSKPFHAGMCWNRMRQAAEKANQKGEWAFYGQPAGRTLNDYHTTCRAVRIKRLDCCCCSHSFSFFLLPSVFTLYSTPIVNPHAH
jgi:hypothetical protein